MLLERFVRNQQVKIFFIEVVVWLLGKRCASETSFFKKRDNKETKKEKSSVKKFAESICSNFILQLSLSIDCNTKDRNVLPVVAFL